MTIVRDPQGNVVSRTCAITGVAYFSETYTTEFQPDQEVSLLQGEFNMETGEKEVDIICGEFDTNTGQYLRLDSRIPYPFNGNDGVTNYSREEYLTEQLRITLGIKKIIAELESVLHNLQSELVSQSS